MMDSMDRDNFFSSLDGLRVYMVGIKGTGMAALAELVFKRGGIVSGSDTQEKFYTDEVLASLDIPVIEGFGEENLPGEVDLVVYSAAYSPETHPELAAARDRELPLLSYPEALGFVSRLSPSLAVAGVHGKTTTTALIGTLLRQLELPVSVLVGSAVPSLGGGSVYVGGDTYFIAETCEYRRHFMNFSPRRIILTSVEPDHLDYFLGYEDIAGAFTDFLDTLPDGGECIYCADDPGARDVADRFRRRIAGGGRTIRFTPYGIEAEGPYGVTETAVEEGMTRFKLRGIAREFGIRLPGRHTVLNCAAALAAVLPMAVSGSSPVGTEGSALLDRITAALADFSGSRRRSEILGEAGGILFMDDYGHHPTAIRSTLEGLKRFYPRRRLVVDFMSHTYSRTGALFEEFAGAFSAADLVVFHKIYGSAREKHPAEVTGKKLCEAARDRGARAVYYHEVPDARGFLETELRSGDLFLTLGAGNNWTLGRHLYEHFRSIEPKEETAV
jgi:UDP-N-acetylmuramate--alanine ligase